MQILMVTDMEGVAGVVSFKDQSAPDGKYYEVGKRLLTGEVNSAVEGLIEAGVDDILVWDAHGAGGITFQDLHPAAKLLHGPSATPDLVFKRRISGTEGSGPFAAEYDACIIIGQHAMAGVASSNQSHTLSYDRIESCELNARSIGEIGMVALSCGALGIPLVFLSGEEEACREAEALVPGITTVSVKRGLSRGAAVSLAASEAQRRIREGAARAIARHRTHPIEPLVWQAPYVMRIRFCHPDAADCCMIYPGAERADSRTVLFRGSEIMEVLYIPAYGSY